MLQHLNVNEKCPNIYDLEYGIITGLRDSLALLIVFGTALCFSEAWDHCLCLELPCAAPRNGIIACVWNCLALLRGLGPLLCLELSCASMNLNIDTCTS